MVTREFIALSFGANVNAPVEVFRVKVPYVFTKVAVEPETVAPVNP